MRVLDVDRMSPPQVVERIVGALGERGVDVGFYA
jgi:hypothetical protein